MFGKDAQTAKVKKLVEKKAQLEAALPVVDEGRAVAIEARLDKIEAAIAREVARAKAIGNVAAIKAALGVDGIGGLEFTAMSPPGVGRLVRLPFYAQAAPVSAAGNGLYSTAAGASAASLVNPVISWNSPVTGGANNSEIAAGAAIQLQTPQISWATLRIVGFEVSMTSITTGDTALTMNPGSYPGPKLAVSDLQIGGGANLFTHEDFGDADIYNANQPEFCGLRDYPILKSPNTATVQCYAAGMAVVSTVNATVLTFSCALLCEVLQDDNYGSHIPGPYARKGAMVRRGGSFV